KYPFWTQQVFFPSRFGLGFPNARMFHERIENPRQFFGHLFRAFLDNSAPMKSVKGTIPCCLSRKLSVNMNPMDSNKKDVKNADRLGKTAAPRTKRRISHNKPV